MQIDWKISSFEELNTRELFEYLKLRQDVFVVEQECAYPDIDATDLKADHILGWHELSLVACARLIPAGITYEYPSIGRIATSNKARGTGVGRLLMDESLTFMHQQYPGEKIKIGAQQRLEKFYQSYGFKTVSEMYLEDGIPHIDMLQSNSD